MPRMSAARDNFVDNSVSASAWVVADSGSAVTAETGGQIRFTLPSSTAGAHLARLTSRYQHDLTSDDFYINIGTMVATGVAASAFMQLYLDGPNTLQWVQTSGTLYARTYVAGVAVDRYSVTWSATTHKYLRIRENAGNVEWYTSTNGTSWTVRAVVAVASLFPVTALFIDMGASCGNIASPGSFRLDDVNLILPALSTTWRHTRALWALVNRHKRVTLAIDVVGTLQGYLVTADGMDASGEPSGSIRYWSGPAGGGRLLTEQTTQAAAEDMAVDVPLDGTFDLPEQVDARFFRLYHRSIDGTATTLREFYPRRLVQADDIEAESIRAINIAAGAITVDKLDVLLTMTGRTIQTAYNGARVVLSGDAFGGFIGYDDTDTYSTTAGTGTYQVLWKLTDGKFYAGAGSVVADANGIEVQASGTSDLDINAYSFRRAASATKMGGVYATDASSVNNITIWAKSIAALASQVVLKAESPAGKISYAALSVGPSGGSAAYVSVSSSSTGGTAVTLNSILSDATHGVIANNLNVGGSLQGAGGGQIITTGDITIGGGLNVGSASGAGTGDIKASGSAGFGNALDSANVRVLAKGHDTGATKYAFVAQDSAAATTFYARNDGTVFASLKYIIGGLQVVGARQTGWGLPTGTLYRTALTNASTQAQFNQAIMALITDLHATGGHGLVG